MSNLIVAIDGPSASGKGTIAKLLADKLNIKYMPTGNMYRAIAKRVLANQIDIDDVKSILQIASQIKLHDLYESDLNNEVIGSAASKIASLPEIRKEMYDFQRNFALNEGKAILEGRDIGTVIYPEAEFKFFITASPEVRAQRRYKELQEKGFQVIYNEVVEDMKLRDLRDTQREDAPLKAAKDSVIIDTTNMNIEQVITYIMNILKVR
jgi:CMP/dCMP kinase